MAPKAPPAPATELQMPMARVRSRGSVKVVVMMVSVAGESTAPPRPCSARAAVSSPEFWARPPSRLAREKSAQPAEEDLALAEEVGEPAAEQQEAGEREHVTVHDPLQACGAVVQVAADGRKGDVHDRHVKHDHELAQADDREDQAVGRLGRSDRAARWECCAASVGCGCLLGLRELLLAQGNVFRQRSCQPRSNGAAEVPASS